MALKLFNCGDVELNPGPQNTKYYYFSLCHWNLNSLLAHDFSKLPSIEAYNIHHNLDIIRLSGTFLDSFYADDDMRINSKDWTFIREDNPHNCKGSGVSIDFKKHLVARPVSPLNSNKYLELEINIQNKIKGYVISMYGSPTQSRMTLTVSYEF